jgi:anti-sigma B factor antagonist
MNVSTRDENGFWVVHLEGRLDIGNAAEFEKACLAWIDEGRPNLVLDFGDLEYISSAGLRSILAATKKAKAANGSLSLCSLSGLVAEVISISGFDSILTVFEDVPQATAGGQA